MDVALTEMRPLAPLYNVLDAYGSSAETLSPEHLDDNTFTQRAGKAGRTASARVVHQPEQFLSTTKSTLARIAARDTPYHGVVTRDDEHEIEYEQRFGKDQHPGSIEAFLGAMASLRAARDRTEMRVRAREAQGHAIAGTPGPDVPISESAWQERRGLLPSLSPAEQDIGGEHFAAQNVFLSRSRTLEGPEKKPGIFDLHHLEVRKTEAVLKWENQTPEQFKAIADAMSDRKQTERLKANAAEVIVVPYVKEWLEQGQLGPQVEGMGENSRSENTENKGKREKGEKRRSVRSNRVQTEDSVPREGLGLTVGQEARAQIPEPRSSTSTREARSVRKAHRAERKLRKKGKRGIQAQAHSRAQAEAEAQTWTRGQSVYHTPISAAEREQVGRTSRSQAVYAAMTGKGIAGTTGRVSSVDVREQLSTGKVKPVRALTERERKARDEEVKRG